MSSPETSLGPSIWAVSDGRAGNAAQVRVKGLFGANGFVGARRMYLPAIDAARFVASAAREAAKDWLQYVVGGQAQVAHGFYSVAR